MSDALGIGSIVGAFVSADAQRQATQRQIDALREQRNFVFSSIDPSVIGPLATDADIKRAQARLALQGQIDPALLQARYQAQAGISDQLSKIASGQSPGDQIAAQAVKETLESSGQMDEVKKRLIDEALSELKAGATLPPDVQAELVKSGLEQTGMTTGAATGRGVGNKLITQLIGREGLQLQAERQRRAQELSSTAQQLAQSRAQILQNLFPNLKNLQLANLGATQNVLEQANRLVPEAGIGGTDVANLWLARVGATNQLAQSAADAASRGAMAQGQIWGNLAGSLGGSAAGSAGQWSRLANLWGQPSGNVYGAGGEAPLSGGGVSEGAVEGAGAGTGEGGGFEF